MTKKRGSAVRPNYRQIYDGQSARAKTGANTGCKIFLDASSLYLYGVINSDKQGSNDLKIKAKTGPIKLVDFIFLIG